MKFPALRLIVCANDDASTPGNPGLTKEGDIAVSHESQHTEEEATRPTRSTTGQRTSFQVAARYGNVQP